MSRFHDEEGAALIVAMGFLAFFGIVIGAILGLARASVGTTQGLAVQRSNAYAADAALEVAIRAGRKDPAIGGFGASPCMHSTAFTTTATTSDATTATVTCVATQAPLADRDVIFTARVNGVAIAVAEVRYLDDPLAPAGTPSSAQVLRWTYGGHDNACT